MGTVLGWRKAKEKIYLPQPSAGFRNLPGGQERTADGRITLVVFDFVAIKQRAVLCAITVGLGPRLPSGHRYAMSSTNIHLRPELKYHFMRSTLMLNALYNYIIIIPSVK